MIDGFILPKGVKPQPEDKINTNGYDSLNYHAISTGNLVDGKPIFGKSIGPHFWYAHPYEEGEIGITNSPDDFQHIKVIRVDG